MMIWISRFQSESAISLNIPVFVTGTQPLKTIGGGTLAPPLLAQRKDGTLDAFTIYAAFPQILTGRKSSLLLPRF
jgi:hypothetical protein